MITLASQMRAFVKDRPTLRTSALGPAVILYTPGEFTEDGTRTATDRQEFVVTTPTCSTKLKPRTSSDRSSNTAASHPTGTTFTSKAAPSPTLVNRRMKVGGPLRCSPDANRAPCRESTASASVENPHWAWGRRHQLANTVPTAEVAATTAATHAATTAHISVLTPAFFTVRNEP